MRELPDIPQDQEKTDKGTDESNDGKTGNLYSL